MKLRWTGPALTDLDRIATFNEQRSVGWARLVNHRIVERCQSLLRHPAQGRPILSSSRRVLSIPDVQYVVSYDVLGDEVRILRVRSTREIQDEE
jgi:toxin ParE1/3/4